jgi:hypothetical protein
LKLIKVAIFGSIILIIGTIIFLYLRGRNNIIDFTETIELGHLKNTTLTIYYMDPSILIFWPPNLSVEDLKGEWYEYRIVIDGEDLLEHSDLLKQIDSISLIPIDYEHHVNARIYLRFESRRRGEVYSVVVSADPDLMLVNGVMVKSEPVFFEVLKQFLPDDGVDAIEFF